jgi:RIP homotypic interaction motif
MDPITLIVAALAAGAAAGALDTVKDGAKAGVQAAYAKLRGLAKKRVAAQPDGELALERHEASPQKWESLLTAELTEAGAAGDADLVAAAKALMELVDGVGARAGEYNVTVANSTGVQVGDGNVQFNNFGATS